MSDGDICKKLGHSEPEISVSEGAFILRCVRCKELMSSEAVLSVNETTELSEEQFLIKQDELRERLALLCDKAAGHSTHAMKSMVWDSVVEIIGLIVEGLSRKRLSKNSVGKPEMRYLIASSYDKALDMISGFIDMLSGIKPAE